MSLHPTGLLGLVLCLGQMICAQEGMLPRPSISAEPDSVIPRGRPVTIVCQGPAGVATFRLENEEDTNDFKDMRASSPLGPHQTEARFRILAVSEGTGTHYRCRYIKEHVWSEPSESLELVVTGGRLPGSRWNWGLLHRTPSQPFELLRSSLNSPSHGPGDPGC
ncbi:leukocyte-associated immunoglobulin-like receptor 2 isoform X1 [Vicugna pacos]|uniref:Leukocyte-associated immunoglobulin-like receptor 2 isoform X1 n=1 Tax=Vicugna pacos TaxID=30538 RepID=A0ABM5DUH3_VICPA